jgi:ribosomal protein S10
MECDICGKHPVAKLPFNCTTCARSALYPLRIEHATALLQKEETSRLLEAVVAGDSAALRDTATLDGAIVDTHNCAKAYHVQETKAETVLIEDRIRAISDKAGKLREQIAEHKKVIKELKADVSRRKSDAESAKYGLDTRSAAELDTVQKSIRRTVRRWDLDHQNIVRGRVSLCKEAARLAGLRRIKTVEGQSIREHWEIGKGLRIFDLREMNSEIALLLATILQISNIPCRCRPRSLDRFADTAGIPCLADLNLSCTSAAI